MNLEKTVFAFFIVLALTLNFGFFYGPIDALYHNPYELFAALVVNLIAIVLKFGDRTHVGATMLATGLVATLQLIAAAFLGHRVAYIMVPVLRWPPLPLSFHWQAERWSRISSP